MVTTEATPLNLSLLRLLQLASPALPVGAYTYSQGLEWAVEQHTIHNEATTAQWIGELLEHNIGSFEAPMLAAMMNACNQHHESAGFITLAVLNADFLASRETSELRAETVQMGYSLTRLLADLPDFPPTALELLRTLKEPAFPAAWACASSAWQISAQESLIAYLWSWAENQVMAAIKAVPLGQTAGQRILLALGSRIPAVAQRALSLSREGFSNFAPGFSIASSRHETQYSRLFRS